MGRKSREKRVRPEAMDRRAAAVRPPAGVRLLPPREALLVAATALLLRAVYALLYREAPFFHAPVVDAQTFHLWAEAIRDGRPFLPGVFFKPPLYPYLLAFLYDLFGTRPAPVYLLQALLGAGTCVLALGLGRLLFSPRTALAGALICALLPILPFLEFQLVAEPLTTFLVMAALLVAVTRGDRGPQAAAVGLLLGIAALGRPNLLVLAPVLAFWVWRRGGRRLQPAVVLLVATGLGIAPATLHNLGHGRLVPISANAGANLWTGIRPGADGVSAIPIGIQWDDLQLEAAEAGAPDSAAADAWLVRRSLAAAAADPARALGLLGRKALLLVNAHEGRNNIGADYLARTQGVVVLHRWWPGFWLLAPLALLGLVAVLRPRTFAAPEPRPALAPVLWTLAALAVAVLPFFVNARFRQPLLPLLALLAAHGAAVLPIAARAGRRQLAGALGVLALAAVVVNAGWFQPDRARGDAIDELHLAGILAAGYRDRPADLDAALARLERGASLDPGNPDLHERRGLYLQASAHELLAAAERAHRVGGAPGRLVGAARDRLVEAVGHHRQAIRLYPRSFRSHGSAGGAHLLLAQLGGQEAAAALAAGDTVHARRAAVAAAADGEAALGAWQEAMRLQPALPGGRESLAAARDAVAALPDLDEAIAAARARLGRIPD